jgi:hypothetical protein
MLLGARARPTHRRVVGRAQSAPNNFKCCWAQTSKVVLNRRRDCGDLRRLPANRQIAHFLKNALESGNRVLAPTEEIPISRGPMRLIAPQLEEHRAFEYRHIIAGHRSRPIA